MRRWMLLLLAALVGIQMVNAQDNGLVTQDVTVIPEVDGYGQTVLVAEGLLVNQSGDAYTNITLLAEVYDADNTLIGEGIGYPVNACLAGLLPDFTLQPDASQPFAVTLELYEGDAEAIQRVEILAQAEATDPQPDDAAPILNVVPVTRREVVSVEWIDRDNLRYGTGCWRDLFTRWDWYEYNVAQDSETPITHPKTEFVEREAMHQQVGLTDPALLNRSFMSFDPNGRRMVYQNELNTIITAEPDGSFKRVLYEGLANRTLQGIYWLAQPGRFLAYYYGAFGDPVIYFTADVDGQTLGEPPEETIPSLIVPGANPDGTRLVLAVEQEGRAGYYLKRMAFKELDPLFTMTPPGNNWPAPLWRVDEATNTTSIYVALPIDGQPRLHCFNLQTRALHELMPLPLQLADDERARWWLSPDNARIALAANGVNGGLWLIELDAPGQTCE
ncbi:MAG: hypothetical protein HZC41_11940 [Chloroflexi bacterium]|nr:hypothetical protein [Chloroflexota bacterium]